MSWGGPSKVFVDANVLYSRTLRDWVALLRRHPEQKDSPSVYRVLWSEDVMAEALYSLRRDHPTWQGHRIAQIREAMEATFSHGRVREYSPRVVEGDADPHDAHVRAAATAGNAQYLLTCNTKDFPQDDTAPYEVIHPDDFFVTLEEAYPLVVREVVKVQMKHWASRREEALLPEHLERAGCPRFAEVVRRHQAAIGRVPYLLPGFTE